MFFFPKFETLQNEICSIMRKLEKQISSTQTKQQNFEFFGKSVPHPSININSETTLVTLAL